MNGERRKRPAACRSRRRSTIARIAAGFCSLSLLFAILWCREAAAEEATVQTLPARPKPFAYGILIGSNRGGVGQSTLHYAGDDARKMAAVLKDVGRYGPGDIRVLLEPTASDVMIALDAVGQRLREHERKNEQAVFVLYYSGHAKANAMHLGPEQIEITTLRDRLRTLPSTLTLVVLDACQSGALHRTKGATPAADFSYNSVARLTTQGIAVMASSNGQELSQESDELRGSYFTHHLVVALRGAGDLDRDGKVTLEEAYRYAYRRTLVATERTAVGAQHVTLETDLSGQGDVPLTFPAEARSQIELPAALEGRVVVQQRASGAIVAEIHKVGGAPVRLALASGEYDIIVRVGSTIRTCATTLTDGRVMALDLGRCTLVSEVTRPKGGDDSGNDDRDRAAPAPPPERSSAREEQSHWILELGLGVARSGEDAYVERLHDFEYRRTSGTMPLRLSGMVARSFAADHLALGIEAINLSSAAFERDSDHVELGGFGLAPVVRASLPFEIGRVTRLALYAQARAGLAVANESIATTAKRTDDSHLGFLLGGDAGMSIYGRVFGGFLSAGYDYAPAIKNALSDRHNLGGAHVVLGLRLQAR